MSDFSQGEGWWQASDGKWYPPENAAPGYAAPTQQVPAAPFPAFDPTQPIGQPMGAPAGAPGGPPPGPPPTPAKSGLGTGPIIGIAIATVLIIGAIVFFATSGGDKKKAVATGSSSSSSSSSSRSSSSRSSDSDSSSSDSSSDGAPDINAPPGFKVFSDDADAFAVAVPDNLEIGDLTSGDADAIISQLTADHPEFANFETQLRTVINGGGKLFAVDLVAPNVGDNLSIIKTPGTFDVQSASAKAELKRQIESFGGSNITFSSRTIHDRKVLTAAYEASNTASDGSTQTFFGGQAYIPDGGSIWILTLTKTSFLAADFDTIITTFDVNS